MKYFLALILILGFIQPARTATVLDFVKGFVVGLHLDNLSPVLRECVLNVNTNIKVFKELISELKKDHSTFEKIDMITKALWYIPDPCRSCTRAPKDVWENFKKKFLEDFDYDIIEYLHAVFIGLGKNKDKILDNLDKLIIEFKTGNYYNSGYYTGDIVNIVLNVSNEHPKATNYQFAAPIVPSIDWDVFHEKFVKYFGYSIIVLNHTKFVDAEHINELNTAVLGIEMKIYLSTKDFTDNKILEGALKLVDILKFANKLFRGSYFSIVQVAERCSKNLIFSHWEYFTTNLLLHSGYFIWDGYKLVVGIIEGDWKEILRRGIVVARKFLYLDDDAINDMLSKIEAIED
jgi:hypothetical protein